MNDDFSPQNAVLAERIKSLDRRIDERFIALDKALQLAETHHRIRIAWALSCAAIVISVLTLAVLFFRHG